jgi:hypothetical protein
MASPSGPVSERRWLEFSMEGILHDLQALRAELRALVCLPPALGATPAAEVEHLRTLMQRTAEECALLSAECDRLRDLLPHHPGQEAPAKEVG